MQVVDRQYIEIEGRPIAYVVDWSDDSDMDAEAVKTMNRANRALGVRRGQPSWDLSATVVVPVTGEYNWDRALNNGTELSVVVQEARAGDRAPSSLGRRYRYDRCTITEVGSTGNTSGEIQRTISLIALDKVEE